MNVAWGGSRVFKGGRPLSLATARVKPQIVPCRGTSARPCRQRGNERKDTTFEARAEEACLREPSGVSVEHIEEGIRLACRVAAQASSFKLQGVSER